MRNIFSPKRATEASPEQLATAGAYYGNQGGIDPIDGDKGFVRMGGSPREIPEWTREKARAYSVAAYRTNPMAKAIIDTMTAFCVGGTGLTLQINSEDVREVAEEFWFDPENNLQDQEMWLRDCMIMGEQCVELMVGETSGVVRLNPVDTTNIIGVSLRDGNPLWLDKIIYQSGQGPRIKKTVVRTNEETDSLREGEVFFFRPWRTLLQDARSMPFLMPILDQLDNYDQVMANLVDRTSLARYLVWDVSVDGSERDLQEYVKNRGMGMPKSGGIEFHTNKIDWKPMSPVTGSLEDKETMGSILTQIAGGSGISKPWLGDPGNANRATSLSMAEPVRRRVEGVQQIWVRYMTELVRFAIDRAVASGRLPETVKASDLKGGKEIDMPTARAVSVTGPEIAAADAQINAEILLNLGKSLESMVMTGSMSQAAAQIAAKKAWEDYMGIPYTADLDNEDASNENMASFIAQKMVQQLMMQQQQGQDPQDPTQSSQNVNSKDPKGMNPNGQKPSSNGRRAGKSVKPSSSNYNSQGGSVNNG